MENLVANVSPVIYYKNINCSCIDRNCRILNRL